MSCMVENIQPQPSLFEKIRHEFYTWRFLCNAARSKKEIERGNFSEIEEKDLRSVDDFLKALKT